MTRLRLALGVCAFGLSLGCFTYVPATLDTAPVGSHVQALLSTEGQVLLRDRLGIDRPLLRGELLGRDGETVLLSIRSTWMNDEFGARPLYQRVDILKSHILRIDQRQMDPFRTGSILALGGGAVTLVVIGALVERNPGQADNTGAGGPDDAISSWILRLPFSIR